MCALLRVPRPLCGLLLDLLRTHCPPTSQPCRHAEVQRYTPNQKTGVQPGVFQYPGQHGGGGGFAVGAGDSQHMAALQHMLGQPLGAAGVGGTCVQNGFHQREFGAAVGQACPRHHVADHEHVGAKRHLVGGKALDQLDAQCPELVAHRGVNPGIAAGDAVAGFPGQGGQATHEGAANSQNVYVHGS